MGEWINLKLEIFKGNRESVRMRLSVNGEVVAVSDNFFGWEAGGSSPYDLVQSLTFYSFSATEASLYIDNLSIIGSKAVCTDDIKVIDSAKPK